MLDNGYWTVNAYAAHLTTQLFLSGTYEATLYNSGFTACAGAAQFGVLKNNNNPPGVGANWFIQNPGCHTNTNASTVSRPGMSGFSHFGTGQSTLLLPINLVEFRGRTSPDGDHELSWDLVVTGTSQVRRLVLEVGQAPEALTALGPEARSYRRLSPPFGPSFYRLRIEGVDGEVVYSSVVELARMPAVTASQLEVSVYPNPAREEVTISWRTDGLEPMRI
jgi:hypothetical protein